MISYSAEISTSHLYDLKLDMDIQWNLSVTTTSLMKYITDDYSVMCFNEDWRYQFTLANNFCLLGLI